MTAQGDSPKAFQKSHYSLLIYTSIRCPGTVIYGRLSDV